MGGALGLYRVGLGGPASRASPFPLLPFFLPSPAEEGDGDDVLDYDGYEKKEEKGEEKSGA